MAEPTINQVFGANASQNATQLIISKDDLGLSQSVSVEKLIIAFLLQASNYLNSNNQSINPEIQVLIELSPIQEVIMIGLLSHRRDTFNISLSKPDTNLIDPDNY